MGINTDDCGRGATVEDFDGDGYLDIIVSGMFQSLKYYRNVEGRTFEDITDKAGLRQCKQTHPVVAADYDNDGWVDLIVSRPFHRYVLYRNQGGVFKDVTQETGLAVGELPAGNAEYLWVPTWADFNNDGYLDLFLSKFGQRFPLLKGLLARKSQSSQLFLNVPIVKDGSTRGFQDATEAMGLMPFVKNRIILSAPAGDYDGDGWMDLMLSDYMGRSAIYRNVQGQRFEKTDLIETRRSGFTAAFLDINHDGQLDLFHAAGGNAANSIAAQVFGEGSWKSASAVYFQKDGSFEERLDVFDGGARMGTMGTGYGDINNDGAYEFYLGIGGPEGGFVLPNAFYLGKTEGRQPTGVMENISMLNGFGTIQKGHAVVFFDFDLDGDQDIYQCLGGMWPGDAWPNNFFVNESQLENTFVKIRLRGRETNYYGLGAWIHVTAKTADNQTVTRRVYMNQNTGFGDAPCLAHIGLMDAETIEQVEVVWPVSAKTIAYQAEIGRLNVLDENGSGGAVSEPYPMQEHK